MFTDISVLIPYMSDHGGPRDASFHWVCRYYKALFPGIELCVGELAGEAFSRSQAINKAARQATRDLLVLADSDLIYEPALLLKSAALTDKYGWVIPFNRILRLSQAETELLVGQEPQWPPPVQQASAIEDARRYVGGLTVLSRAAFDAVQGMDERFIGWGAEDDAFACSLDTLSGPRVRLDDILIHLWHPSSSHSNPNYGNNYALFLRYWAARDSAEAMKALIGERQPG
ncbi:N-terminal domain of galactosyltransferase [Paenibacillus sp. UNCCL117]|uniref:galactosyltransferase-related protein n=1 Tax=unclassified Paenibacillus TaxID=185978 RepID=UPI00087EAF97|nr:MULTISPECIES: galactosyltransferase-related protein [unclassified Paenibacillus]SDE66129.1 N-terminal domain of galactosyltransferase [Paenibacillus sp. cl123]SFW70322.1 N-terminal domain of galactosyltransferase [Paenibacillus sp. UNCCL117]